MLSDMVVYSLSSSIHKQMPKSAMRQHMNMYANVNEISFFLVATSCYIYLIYIFEMLVSGNIPSDWRAALAEVPSSTI